VAAFVNLFHHGGVMRLEADIAFLVECCNPLALIFFALLDTVQETR